MPIRKFRDNIQAFGVMEVLVGLAIAGIIALSLSLNMFTTFYSFKKSMVSMAANRLLADKFEELAAINAGLLDDTYDATESSVVDSTVDISFTRVTDVTVNANGTRTILITVSSNNLLHSSSVSQQATFAIFE